MDESANAEEPPGHPPREVIPDGSECFQCGAIVKGTAILWLYRKNRASGKRERYKRHPDPKRYFYCRCGRKWNRFIPKSQLRRHSFAPLAKRPAPIRPNL